MVLWQVASGTVSPAGKAHFRLGGWGTAHAPVQGTWLGFLLPESAWARRLGWEYKPSSRLTMPSLSVQQVSQPETPKSSRPSPPPGQAGGWKGQAMGQHSPSQWEGEGGPAS